MALAETFQQIVDSLPSDWTDLELDLRIDVVLIVEPGRRVEQSRNFSWRFLVPFL